MEEGREGGTLAEGSEDFGDDGAGLTERKVLLPTGLWLFDAKKSSYATS